MAQGRAVADPHALLDIAPGATRDELRQAFRRLAKQHHPDRGGDRSTFEAVRDAYDVLLASALPAADARVTASPGSAPARSARTTPEPAPQPTIPITPDVTDLRCGDARATNVHRSYRTTVDLDLTAFPVIPPRPASSRRPQAWNVAAGPARAPMTSARPSAFASMLADALGR